MKQHAIYNRIYHQIPTITLCHRVKNINSPLQVQGAWQIFCGPLLALTYPKPEGRCIRPVPYRRPTNTRCHCTKLSCTDTCTPCSKHFPISEQCGLHGRRLFETTQALKDSHSGNCRHVTPFSLVSRCQHFRRNFCLNSLALKMEAARSFETDTHAY